MSDTYTFKTPQRAVFINAFEPKAFMKDGKPKGDPKYSITFVIPPNTPELEGLKKAAAAAARAKWPTRNLSELAFPFTNGDRAAEKSAAKGKDGGFYKGQVVFKTRSKYPPTLSVIAGGKLIVLETDALKAQWKSKFYNGCWGVGAVNFVPYDGENDKDGITAYIQSFLWVKDGERIGGRDQAEVFKDYMGTVSNEDPFGGAPGGLDDEIPF